MIPVPSHLFDDIVKDILRKKLNAQRIRPGLIEAWLIVEKTHWRHQQITPEMQVFIPAREIYLKTHLYRELLDYATIQKGYSNHLEKKCDIIVDWQEDFRDDVIKYWEAQIAYARRMRRKQSKNECVVKFYPGADESNYHSTDNSPHRLYHSIQSITKAQKKILYAGHVDFDIVNCFGNLTAREFEKAGLLNEDLQHFLTSKDALNELNDVKHNNLNAKQLRLRAIHGQQDGKLRRTNNERYDKFCQEIQSGWMQLGVDNVHIHLTAIEREMMKQFVEVCGKENVSYLIHDGAMLNPGVDADAIKMQIQAKTGMDWKWEVM